jgi:hypothetical protein
LDGIKHFLNHDLIIQRLLFLNRHCCLNIHHGCTT